MSVVFQMGLPAAEQRLFVLMGAVAASEALNGLGVRASIKWPNDLVVAIRDEGGLKVRKLGGCIAQRVARPDGSAAHIVGLGVNVNQSAAELPLNTALPATSMSASAPTRCSTIFPVLPCIDI